MAIRIEWDEFEIALLIEACEEVLHRGKPKSEVVKTVSSNLRKRAINNDPPAKPGVFLKRAKPYVTSHASCGVGTV